MDLLEPFVKMLEAACPPARLRAAETGAPLGALWDEIAASGFLDALVAEEHGGAGLSLAELAPLLIACGKVLVPAPVAETMVARALLAEAGLAAPEGPIALASGALGARIAVPLGLAASHVLLDTGGELALLAVADGAPEPTGVHGSLAAWLGWASLGNAPVLPRPADGLRAIAALLRAAAIAGAGGHLLELTAGYAQTREQFGKPIGRQQALQQNLAVMAQDAIATRIAVEAACATGFPPRLAAAAAAKAVCSAAAPRLAACAHGVHGAIGISAEYDLQLYTRRLHEWRLADGSESYWNGVLGALRLASDAGAVDWIRTEVFV